MDFSPPKRPNSIKKILSNVKRKKSPGKHNFIENRVDWDEFRKVCHYFC